MSPQPSAAASDRITLGDPIRSRIIGAVMGGGVVGMEARTAAHVAMRIAIGTEVPLRITNKLKLLAGRTPTLLASLPPSLASDSSSRGCLEALCRLEVFRSRLPLPIAQDILRP